MADAEAPAVNDAAARIVETQIVEKHRAGQGEVHFYHKFGCCQNLYI